MGKVILVLSDGLRDDVARDYMGYLEHLIEVKRGTRYTVIGELPTMSRPMYETIHTGVPVSVHGITNNSIVRLSTMPNVFEVARMDGKITAASAHCWFSELYNRVPYDLVMDREVDDPALNIQHGRFYYEDNYPDLETFAAGGMLLRKFFPDYLLIHPMMMDSIGERHGGDSPEYRRNAILQDQILANLIPEALEAGYHVLVTGDHGLSDDRTTHGGPRPELRRVPLYVLPPTGSGAGDTGSVVSMLQIAPTILTLLEVAVPSTMQLPPISLP